MEIFQLPAVIIGSDFGPGILSGSKSRGTFQNEQGHLCHQGYGEFSVDYEFVCLTLRKEGHTKYVLH